MYIKPSRIVPIFVRNGVALFFIFSLIGISFSLGFDNIFEPYSYDEGLYKSIADDFTLDHIKYGYNNVLESKPVTFLILQKVLNSADP